MNIAVLGANGFIEHSLIRRLLNETHRTVVALSPHAESIPLKHACLTKHNIDIFETEKLHTLLVDCDAVYYLVHMMAQKKIDFADAEIRAAESFCTAASNSTIKRVI